MTKRKKTHRAKLNKAKPRRSIVRGVREKGVGGMVKKSFRKVISSLGKVLGISRA